MKVLTFFTHAGGAGKTVLTRDLGFELAQRGYRVLLVDMDPQANLTVWLGAGEVDDSQTFLRVLDTGHLPEPIEVAENYHLVPANVSLALAEVRMMQDALSELSLRGALEKVSEEYDFVLVDSLPSLGKLAIAAALAATYGLVVPVETTHKGLQASLTVLGVARQYANRLKLLHRSLPIRSSFVVAMVPTKYDSRTNLDREAWVNIRALGERAGIPVTSPIHYRPGPYRRAMELQAPVHRAQNPVAISEVSTVTDELLALLGVEEVRHA